MIYTHRRKVDEIHHVSVRLDDKEKQEDFFVPLQFDPQCLTAALVDHIELEHRVMRVTGFLSGIGRVDQDEAENDPNVAEWNAGSGSCEVPGVGIDVALPAHETTIRVFVDEIKEKRGGAADRPAVKALEGSSDRARFFPFKQNGLDCLIAVIEMYASRAGPSSCRLNESKHRKKSRDVYYSIRFEQLQPGAGYTTHKCSEIV